MGATLIEECAHEFCSEGYCSSCGLETGPKLDFDSGYGETHVRRRGPSNRGYCDEMNQVSGISENLKDMVAERLSKNPTRHCRESTRSLQVFCEIYISGAKEGELKPENVASSLKMNGKRLNQCLRVVSGTSRKTIAGSDGETLVMPVVSISPMDSVSDICATIDQRTRPGNLVKLSAHVEEIRDLIARAIKKCPSLLNKRPRYVAAGFIKYYCVSNNFNFGDIGAHISLSSPTLNQYSTEARKLCEQYCL